MKSNTSKESVQSSNRTKIDKVETSLIVKVSLDKIFVSIAGNIDDNKNDPLNNVPIVQMYSNALVMFQSVEDHDASGNKTFHISLKDYSISVHHRYDAMRPLQSPPILGPVAIDFRSVNDTENRGIIVKREVSISSDILKSSFQSSDIRCLINVAKQLLKEVQTFNYDTNSSNKGNTGPSREDKGKGLLVATTLKFQLQPFSFVLMKYCKEQQVICPLLDFRGEAYGKIDGYTSALYGESKLEISLYFFSGNTSDWEHVMEPTSITVDFDEQPNHKVRFFSYLY